MNGTTISNPPRPAVLAGWLFALVAFGAHASPEDDPLTATMPSLDDLFSDPRRGLVLDVLVLEHGVELVDVLVSDVPPGAVDDDPPLLLLEALDAEGNAVQVFHTWDPRWEYVHYEDGERAEPADEGESVGTFEIPFDHRIRRVVFHDLQTEPVTHLGELDVASAVENFCTQNRLDFNCAGFVPADSDADGVADAIDACPGTLVPERATLSADLGPNRWALLGINGVFIQAPPRDGTDRRFTTIDTRGCSCGQIAEQAALGRGIAEFGCPTGVMLDWISGVLTPVEP